MRTAKIGPDLRLIETEIHNIVPRHFEEQLYIINILTRCFYTLQKSKARLLFFKESDLDIFLKRLRAVYS